MILNTTRYVFDTYFLINLLIALSLIIGGIILIFTQPYQTWLWASMIGIGLYFGLRFIAFPFV